MRKFSEPGDVEKALQFVHDSNGIQETRYLARKYVDEANNQIKKLLPSEYTQHLLDVNETVLTRLS